MAAGHNDTETQCIIDCVAYFHKEEKGGGGGGGGGDFRGKSKFSENVLVSL